MRLLDEERLGAIGKALEIRTVLSPQTNGICERFHKTIEEIL